MAKNGAPCKGRVGPVKGRSQTKTPSGRYVKLNTSTGQFMEVKADKAPFKGVRRGN